MIKAKIFEVCVNGIRIVIQPKNNGRVGVFPACSSYMYKTETGERWSMFKFDDSDPKLIRSMGHAFIEAADFVEAEERQKDAEMLKLHRETIKS